VVQSFYQTQNTHCKKPLRKENILNVINNINNSEVSFQEKSVFSGKISILGKKIYLNLN
jgi:hypothetical protein